MNLHIMDHFVVLNDDQFVRNCVVAIGLTLPSGPASFVLGAESAWTTPEVVVRLEDDLHSTEGLEQRGRFAATALKSPIADLGWDLSRMAFSSDTEDYRVLESQSPEAAVAAIMYDVDRRLVTKEAAAEWLFDRLVASRSYGGTPYYDTLLSLVIPKAIARIAFEQYEKKGDLRRLTYAASLLADLGSLAWPTLRSIAQRASAESEYFIGAIARAQGICRAEKIAALEDLARSNDLDVRWGVFRAMEDQSELRSASILSLLESASDPDLVDSASELATLLP